MLVLAAETLAGNFSAGWAVVGGLVGGVAFLAVVYMGLAIAMTRMNFLHILGTMMAPNGSAGVVYGVGFMAHMMLSAVFGLAHAGLLHAIGVDSVGEGIGWDAVIGTGHGVVILGAMPMMLTMMHPLVRKGAMERPGPAMVGFGAGTPLGSLMAHAAFGVVTGAIYVAAVL